MLTVVLACAPATSSPTPPATASVTSAPPTSSVPGTSATPTASAAAPATIAPSPSVARLAMSDAPMPEVVGSYVMFQMPGETKLRATSFGADVNGVLAAELQTDAAWQQDPYGHKYIVGTAIFDQTGKSLGTVPWPAERRTWPPDANLLCGVTPHTNAAGSALRLETIAIGGAVRTAVNAFGSYSDNAGYRVLACTQDSDRAIVATFGQGLYASRLWVFQLSSGAMVRTVDYGSSDAGRWVAASADGTLIAESVQATTGGSWKATVRRADDGATVATLDDVVVQGFSGDNELVVTSSTNTAAVIDWKTNRRVWSAAGTYGGFLAEPANRALAVGLGFVGGSDQRDVYL